MAYDEDLADRIRTEVSDVGAVTEMRMFGGLAFLVGGHMAVAAGDRGVLVRVPPGETEELAGEPHTDRFVMPGRTMKGWLRVEPEGVTSDADLARWVGIGVGYASSLPPK